ncbi:MAG: sigma-70 family RNA polymerase sigma factor [Clostridiales bacterium]|nr:sigma-70 family RNA polymerase sigma factor [Clostridiales bacterium]
MAKPEIRLVERAKAGDAEAFGQLYAQYAQDLYRFAYYYLGSREEAEDAVQDAICAAFQGVGALRSAASFRAWLFSILANTCRHHIAAVKERRLTTPLEEARRLGEGECSEALALALELREAIYALSDEERSIVLLSVIGGYKSHEIAKALSCPPGTVRSKLSRTLARLRLTAEKESS